MSEISPAGVAENPSAVDLPNPAAVEAGARATVLSWAPNTTKSYLDGWNDFTNWCFENRCPGLPATPAVVGRYLEDPVEARGMALATVRNRLAAIAAAHRLGGHEDPTTWPLVKANMKRLAREYGKPSKQAKGLTSEALAEDTYTFMACTLGASIPE